MKQLMNTVLSNNFFLNILSICGGNCIFVALSCYCGLLVARDVMEMIYYLEFFRIYEFTRMCMNK